MQLTDTVCLANKLAIFQMNSDQYPDYFMAQSCLHIVISYLRPPKTDQNMPLFVPVPNSAKFWENTKIPRKRANSAARLEIPWSAENWSLVMAITTLHCQVTLMCC